ncbi:hypothetical protein RIF29_17996 [Crotalaria pallida]|uniref:Uncharacterized protein n=1 Tax=Crotalaria pallida TaxID=3830 RepID=A0AAN9IGZ3_CROPI
MVGAILHINGFSTVHFSPISNHSRTNLAPPKPPMLVRTTQPHPYWASLNSDIEAYLKKAIPMKEPLIVFEPMHHLTFAAPRTTIPALCLMACELVGGDRHQAMAAASALLLLNAATYTHEHLPLIDNRGLKPKLKPMIHHAYDPNIELLTGDGIIPFAFELLARSQDPAHNSSSHILRAIIEISRVMGSKGVIDGQYKKKLASQTIGGELCHVERIKRVVEKNEAALHACGAACGAILGGGSEEEIERLRKYGFHVGMIQGLVQNGLREETKWISNLALKELEIFLGRSRNVDAISAFIHA